MSIHADGANAVRALIDAPRHPIEPTLPTATGVRFTLDDVDLHDLTYHAVSRYLSGLTAMTKERAHLHAGRIAAAAVTNAMASDYLHQGGDNRG